VRRVLAHAPGEVDLLAGIGVHAHPLIVARDFAAFAHEAVMDLPTPRGPGQAHLGQALPEVQGHEGGVLHLVAMVEKRPHRSLHRLGFSQHGA
jgi:hypothetical protein